MIVIPFWMACVSEQLIVDRRYLGFGYIFPKRFESIERRVGVKRKYIRSMDLRWTWEVREVKEV